MCLDLNQYIPGGVLDPMQLSHELEGPEGKFKLARAILQEIPRQVCTVVCYSNSDICWVLIPELIWI